MKITLEMKPANKIISRIFNDKVGFYIASTWGKIFEKYTPMDSGMLSQRYDVEPFKVIYTQKYSYYQWQGVSKKGKPLNYSKEKHYLAQSHWEESAERDKKDEVAKSVTSYLKKL